MTQGASTPDRSPRDHRMVFVGGLHRSGTTLLARLVGGHPLVSGFSGTGVPEDEGQHLQRVYPSAQAYGGPGRFGFDERAHLTEHSPLAGPTSARRLFEQWSPHWDLSRPLLLEKSPPNLLATRFLQALFPGAHFIVIVRHPAAVALATRRRDPRQRLLRLLRHWFHVHALLISDLPSLDHVLVVRYERLLEDPDVCRQRLAAFLGVPDQFPPLVMDREAQEQYLRAWRDLDRSARGRLTTAMLRREFEQPANALGYSFTDLQRCDELASEVPR